MALSPQQTTCIVYKSMKQASYSIDTKLKELLNNGSHDFAWEVLQLEISLENNAKPPLEGLMRLIQLYMLGVEVLENEDDERFNYFNNKIHAIMMRKTVVEQLHRIATGTAPDPETIDRAQRMEMESRKNDYQLQISLQKDQYTFNNVKDIVRKYERHYLKKNQRIRDQLEGQNQVLEERIKTRKLRSISRGKQEIEKSPKMVSRASYGVLPKEKEKSAEKAEKVRKPEKKVIIVDYDK